MGKLELDTSNQKEIGQLNVITFNAYTSAGTVVDWFAYAPHNNKADLEDTGF